MTARVITAAAAIMFCVFLSFVLGDDRSLKMFGFGLAMAVLIDATVVRLVLVPSTMELLGDRNWWLRGGSIASCRSSTSRPSRRWCREPRPSCASPSGWAERPPAGEAQDSRGIGGQSHHPRRVAPIVVGPPGPGRFRWAARRLASSRASRAAREGQVGRRGAATMAASSIAAARRPRAVLRLRHCERDSPACARATGPRRRRTRSAPGPSSSARSATTSPEGGDIAVLAPAPSRGRTARRRGRRGRRSPSGVTRSPSFALRLQPHGWSRAPRRRPAAQAGPAQHGEVGGVDQQHHDGSPSTRPAPGRRPGRAADPHHPCRGRVLGQWEEGGREQEQRHDGELDVAEVGERPHVGGRPARRRRRRSR